MNGKIDKCGGFQVERAGKMEGQRCPFSMDLGACGDWCPHFGEPFEEKSPTETKGTILQICNNGYFKFDEFTDERGNQ
jgi:hypothetical protein